MGRLILLALMAGLTSACGTYWHNGADGADGSSCSVEQVVDGAVIRCTDGTMAVIDSSGSQFDVVDVVDPCGDGPGFDEVVLQLAGGQFLAYFEQGSNRFLALLPPGSYQTTDAQACQFSIDSNGNLVH